LEVNNSVSSDRAPPGKDVLRGNVVDKYRGALTQGHDSVGLDLCVWG
jgi:hypothetical protein